MSKKTKFKPSILHTRESMEAEVTEYVKLKLEHIELTARMEREKADIEKQHEARINELAQLIDAKFAGVQNFCETHRGELVTGKIKSFETVNAVIGFRDTPPAVGKRREKETWGSIAKRLEGLVFYHPDDAKLQPENRRVILDCSKYVKEADPELSKTALLADRARLTADQLLAMGVAFTSEEHFFVEPKSQVAAGDAKEAA